MNQVCIDSGLGEPFAGEICPGIDSKKKVRLLPTPSRLRYWSDTITTNLIITQSVIPWLILNHIQLA